jgi:hypothetical protein
VYGLLALLAFYGFSTATAKSLNPFVLAVGADGLLSVSKFQFLAWNMTVLFCYVWLLAADAYTKGTLSALSIPKYTLTAMGLSIATLATAKGITVSYVSAGRISKPDVNGSGNPSELVTQDDGQTPDLVKMQMLIWTVVAIVVYIIQTAIASRSPDVSMAGVLTIPDIDPVFMILMGLGQAAYLGNKLTGSDTPVITNLNPAVAKTNQKVVVSGTNLGGMLTTYFDCIPVGVTHVPLTASSFELAIPTQLATTAANVNMATIAPGTRFNVSVNVDGVQSANSMPIVVSG